MKLLEIPIQTPASEVDEEILEIFVEEVAEVLNEIISSFEAWRANPSDIEALQTLRRNFHTLKGSGRLVGATVIGELGWKFENLLNRILDNSMSRSDTLLKLIEQVPEHLPVMIEEFKDNRPPHSELVLLISQTDYFTKTKGESLGDFELDSSSSPTSTPSVTNSPVVTAVAPTPPVVKEVKAPKSIIDELPELTEEDTLVTEGDDFLNEGNLADFPNDENLNSDDALLKTDFDILNTAELETTDVLAESDFSLENLETTDFNENTLTDFESTTTDLPDLSDDLGSPLTTDSSMNLPDLSGDVSDSLVSDDAFSNAAAALIVGTDQLPEGLTDADIELVSQELADSSVKSVENTDFTKTSLPEQEEKEDEKQAAIDPVLLEIFRKEANGHLNTLINFVEHYQKDSESALDNELIRVFHTLNGSSRSVNLMELANIAAPLENYVRQLVAVHCVVTSEILVILEESVDLISTILAGQKVESTKVTDFLTRLQMPIKIVTAQQPAKTAETTQHETTNKAPSTTVSTPEIAPDAADEFMSIFLDEAEEILENTQTLLEKWQASPQNMQTMKELQRELHTLKGGARMVGIVAMGDLSHHLESVLTKIVEGNAQANTRLQEVVQRSVDELAAMLESVREGNVPRASSELIQQINGALSNKAEGDGANPTAVTTSPTQAPVVKPAINKTEAAETEAKREIVAKPEKIEKAEDRDSDSDAGEDRIRVRVSLIDKLTNLAGELSISRAHLEQQQGSVKNNLSEMEQTVFRLRDQLRRMEIETEAQILSHYRSVSVDFDGNDDEEFDPLEMDRFSVLQQLSRSLMETINDLLNIQDSLKTLARQSDALLIQQSRIGAELQDGIMRTRMIPFARISPRLQRIARLTARELRKQVDFVIEGEGIEFERTVLNRVVAPLEHMLRNAIGHGIEDAETRQQSGKSTVAKVKIELFKEGSELMVRVSDDGAGLNLAAIRRKAEERNMLSQGTVISDQELIQFILEPSFSTASKITQVSGRGVGMDVVNSEVKQLGGTLQIFSKAGEGTTFEIRLPLSLTINQALLVYIGDETLAIPMSSVDAVMRLPRQDVLPHANKEPRYYKYMDAEYRLFPLGELLGLAVGVPDFSLIPTLLIRAGERRIALLVDGIEGSREVVVKSVGPQISAIRWIAGATILGDGRVVIILDVPTLTRAESTIAQEKPTLPKESKVETVSASKTIMVVDDSITVRKVTARLLQRQGMEVLTAKDGVDAVAQLQEHIPDLMLLDIEMPRMDGYELATQIRNTPNLKHIPIIMITSRTGTKHRDKAEKIGINRYLGKPFNETELLENINALLAESAAGRLH